MGKIAFDNRAEINALWPLNYNRDTTRAYLPGSTVAVDFFFIFYSLFFQMFTVRRYFTVRCGLTTKHRPAIVLLTNLNITEP